MRGALLAKALHDRLVREEQLCSNLPEFQKAASRHIISRTDRFLYIYISRVSTTGFAKSAVS